MVQCSRFAALSLGTVLTKKSTGEVAHESARTLSDANKVYHKGHGGHNKYPFII